MHARSSAPHYHGSAMDGIATRAEDTFGASEFEPKTLLRGDGSKPGQFAFVDTGSALPRWANAVIMIERVYPIVPEPSATPGPERIEIREAAHPWQHVRLVGEDVVATEPILPRGHRIRPPDIGAMLAAGIVEVEVAAQPRVAILPTGDELIEPGADAPPGRVIEFNSRMIAAYVRDWGGRPVRCTPVPDDPDAIERATRTALAENDLVLVLAGSSAGERDYTVEVLGRIGEILAHGIDVMPGKPAILAVSSEGPMIGLPGYPVSTVIIAHEIVRTTIARFLGAAPQDPTTVDAVIPRKIPSRLGLQEYVRVTLGRVGDRLVATPLGRGAGVITSMVQADGILRIPSHVEGLNAGEPVAIELLRSASEIDRTILVAGSHDLSLSILEDCLRCEHPNIRVSATNVGSIGGLVALGRGEAHAAGTHLLDVASGEYNLADVDRLLPGRDVRIVNLVQREQGLIVAPGNPKRLGTLADLAREDVRFVNRQRGAGTRVLLDARLEALGLDPGRITGYEREEVTHMAVAVAVASGLADVGLGIHQAAAALGLDFVAVESEDYDLVFPAGYEETELGSLLLKMLGSTAFRDQVSALTGYDISKTGTFKR